jgi:hypothetical protein
MHKAEGGKWALNSIDGDFSATEEECQYPEILAALKAGHSELAKPETSPATAAAT